MKELLKITLIGLVSGLAGTGLGGLAVLFVRSISKRTLCFVLEMSAGLMLSVSCIKLVPESMSHGNILISTIGILSGAFSILLCETYIINPHIKTYIKTFSHNTGLIKTGLMVGIGIALHNFPEGIAVGSGFESSTALGITISAVILLHDIPEGVAVALPIKAGGVSALKAFLFTLATGVPMAAGAFIGAAISSISEASVSACLGFAAGAMLFIVFLQIIPESKRQYQGRFSSLGGLVGVICGIIICTGAF